jgi:small GTP-binding protein
MTKDEFNSPREKKEVERQKRKKRLINGEYALKLIMVSDIDAAKTNILEKYARQISLSDYRNTIGVNIWKKEVEIEELGLKLRFVIWDLAGKTQFKRVKKTYLKNTEVAFIIFNVSYRHSFESVKDWYKDIRANSPPNFIFLIGNKSALEEKRKVSISEGKKMAANLDFPYLETCIKTDENINDAFQRVAIDSIKKVFTMSEIEQLKKKKEAKNKKNLEKIKEVKNSEE